MSVRVLVEMPLWVIAGMYYDYCFRRHQGETLGHSENQTFYNFFSAYPYGLVALLTFVILGVDLAGRLPE